MVNPIAHAEVNENCMRMKGFTSSVMNFGREVSVVFKMI